MTLDINVINGKQVFTASNKKSPLYDAYERDIAVVTFFFENPTILEFGREIRMTTLQYISQVGGLLGLCIGFSFFSGLEILFWIANKFFQHL